MLSLGGNRDDRSSIARQRRGQVWRSPGRRGRLSVRRQGEFVGLIGPNGAGKTTLIRIVAGLVKSDRGKVFLAGADVTGDRTSARVRRGLAFTHQIVRPFREMSVLDNVTLAAGIHRTSNPLRALIHVSRRYESERAAAIVQSVRLAGTEYKLAGTLPLGQLKRLELARALAVDPNLLLLDEPLAGLNHKEASRQAETIVEINRRGVTIVLVEHNLEEVMRICRRLVVLNSGKVIVDGEPREVMSDPAVQDAYVGGAIVAHAEA
jgi:branched-chain amino acid transport system ATP-binding protein